MDIYGFLSLSDLDCGWGSEGQQKAKHFGFIFSHTFHLIRVEFAVVLKKIKLNFLVLLLIEVYLMKGNNCCFTDCF